MNKMIGLVVGLSALLLGSLAHAVGNITAITNNSPYFVGVSTKTNVGNMQQYFSQSVWHNGSFILGPTSSVSGLAIRVPNPKTDSGNDPFHINVFSSPAVNGVVYNDGTSMIGNGVTQAAYNLNQNQNISLSIDKNGVISMAASS